MYHFNGTAAQFEKKALGIKNVIVTRLDPYQYRVKPQKLPKGQPFGRTNLTETYIYITVFSICNTLQKVKLTTPIRSEYFIIGLIFLFVEYASVFSNHNYEMALLALAIIICLLPIFHFFYRLEENWIIELIEAQLELVKV
ncbi:MAG: hypothetical protein JST82_14595 [Bacteroidetes bacterium]|nr:hypothetical protein [Bacteroidota bacterium]